MDVKSKNGMWRMIVGDLLSINKRHEEISKRLEENAEDQKEYLKALFNQLLQPSSVPVVTKTPKITRKRGFQRIETIPEDDVLEQENEDAAQAVPEKDTASVAGGRTKRIASLKAVDNITKQSLLMQNTKMRRLSDESISFSVKKGKRESQLKRKKSLQNSSDEEENKVPSKYSKLDMNDEKKEPVRKTRKMTEQIAQPNEDIIEKTKKQNKSRKSQSSSSSESKKSQEKETKKDNDVIISPTTDVVEESIYEDAIGKPTPIMNSTLKYSVMPERMLNATVVLEALPQQRRLNETVVLEALPQQRRLNETMVIQKGPNQLSSRENSRERTSLKKAQHGSTRLSKEAVGQNVLDDALYNGLITDDESSFELTKSKKQIAKKLQRRMLSVSSDDDDNEIPNTPVKNAKKNFKEPIALAATQEMKTTYKSNALFSPYAKESVKKKIEAFEQAVMQSPKSVDVNAPTRVTRTKTRAMAAAEAEAETKNTDKNYTQILARKSLAKAKKIACFVEKQKKDNEESREKEKETMPERINKPMKYDKNAMLVAQIKITPLSKPKIVAPMSATRLQTPLSTQNNLLNHGKALTASRTNIVTAVESFIQAPKTATKNNSADKLEDKRRNEEDVIKKRKEALKLQTQEKKRKREEKELKNKLAREAKEKQELEKRQKAEKEREEKAKLAQLMQEKQREEMEKKRLAQLQRAQEKEERRRLEEQQRLQKLLDQEEAERLLAEQKRREQEAERRKEMEARAQQQAEMLRQKNMQAAQQVKYKQAGTNKQPGTTNYVLDSEPDDDDSDDESRPKHEIPHWAQSHVRKMQLAMQRHIPNEIVYKFFDTRKCTPDLTDLFQGIDRNRLKRTSSAIWKTPPRFSMMEGE